jgi:hypothetical protein
MRTLPRAFNPTEEGFGRTDAFRRIANSVFGDAIGPSNYAAPIRR